MRRILIIIVLFTVFFNTFGQRNGIEYIDYNLVIADLIKHKTESIFYPDLNYEAMIIIDKSCTPILLSVNPEFISDKGIDTSSFDQEKSIKNAHRIKTDIDDIKDYFENEELFQLANNTYRKSQNRRLPVKIYIKQPDLACYEIKGESWSEANFVKLINNELLITNIYRIIGNPVINE